MKLVLLSEQQKEKIIRNAKNLRSSKDTALHKVFIHQDMTPKQRKRRQELVNELRRRQAQGQLDLIIIGDKIVTRRQIREFVTEF